MTSAANLSDGISRGRWEEADAFGCQPLCPKFERFYKFFVNVQQGKCKDMCRKFSELVNEVADVSDYQPARGCGEQRA